MWHVSLVFSIALMQYEWLRCTEIESAAASHLKESVSASQA